VNYHNDAEEGPAKQHNKKKHRFLKVFSALLAFVLVISIISSVSVASVFTIVKVFLVSVLSLLIVLIFIVIVSPVPVALIVRFAFRNGPAVAPENYEEIAAAVTSIKDLSYPSEYKDNIADVFIPQNQKGKTPVVLWVHGGAFVGGSKKDVEIYATMLASEGIAVININYQRAPEAKYPVPIMQTEEAYRWLVDISDKYNMDLSRIILAGDSAGAHIVSQFATVQTSEEYAEKMGMEQVMPVDTLKAVVLFCGPFDVESINKTDNSILDFLLGRTAWAYFGIKNWADDFSEQVAVLNHITADFPPTFISDGNTYSFEDHGRSLADILAGKGVPVEVFFVPADEKKIMHEYQFIMNTDVGQDSFRKTVNFMKKYIGE